MAVQTDVLQIRLETTGDGRVRAELAGVARGTQQIGGGARTASIGLGALASVLGALSLGALLRELVGVNAEFQRLNAQLRTVTGSAGAAGAAFDEIERFASQTPFQLEEVVGAFVRLKSLGLDPGIDALRAYGNTSAAMGTSLTQFIEAVADATVGEFERLKEFGIKARSEGDQVTFLFRGLATTVEKEAGAIEGYLRSIGEVEFAGAMEAQADTLGVAFSNLQDAIGGAARRIGESGLNQLLADLTRSITGLVRAASGAPRPLAELADELERLQSGGGPRGRNRTQAGRQALIGEIEAEIRQGLESLGGEAGLRAQLQSAEDDLRRTLTQRDALLEQIAQIPEAERVVSEGRGRNRRLTLFGSLQGELAQINEQITATTTRVDLLRGSLSDTLLGQGGGGDGGGGQPPAPAAETAPDEDPLAASLAQYEQHLAQRYTLLSESLLSERELEQLQHEERLLLLEDAFTAGIIPTWEQYHAQVEELEAQHQDRMRQIEKKGWTKRQKFEAAALDAKAAMIFGELGSITQGVAQHNRALFELNKVAAIGSAIISTQQGAAKALEWGFPLGPIFAGIIAAAGLARVAAISSTQFGGAGGAVAPSLAGTGAGGVVATVPASPQIPEAQERASVEINIEQGVYDHNALRAFAEELGEVFGDGGGRSVRVNIRGG